MNSTKDHYRLASLCWISCRFSFLGAGVSLFLGQLATQGRGSDWGGLIVFFGIYYCILMVIAGVKYTVQDRTLKEDLEHPAPNPPEEDQKKLRKFMHPCI